MVEPVRDLFGRDVVVGENVGNEVGIEARLHLERLGDLDDDVGRRLRRLLLGRNVVPGIVVVRARRQPEREACDEDGSRDDSTSTPRHRVTVPRRLPTSRPWRGHGKGYSK